MEENQTTDTVTSSGSEAILPLDPFLQLFVQLANQTDIELKLTLHVSGFLVAGTLVSVAKYLDGYIADFTRGMDESWAATIRGQLLSLAAPPPGEQDAPVLPQFIHFKEARLFHPSGEPIPKNRPIWWRGRLSAVAAFTLGSLERG